ncbi:MAG TPA: YciI family protein [Polyangiaceae bacterium]|jgi:hypothetical protein|nr:YciI family protein [Polyangiaceae bacterium]
MPDYLLMVLENESAHAAESPRAMAELIEKRAAFADGLRRAGQLRDAGRLRPSPEGKRIRRRGEALEIQVGPFAEESKALSAYYWVAADELAAAARLARECPTLAGDDIDVRPLMKGEIGPEKEAKPGKIFACAVLGASPNEAAWVGLMDRIDAETTPQHAEGFVGGLRLEPPKRGTRVATRGEKRVAFDGPFLESKEVIGGICFLRLASLEDALSWAAATRFVVHGTLEIRELWRS